MCGVGSETGGGGGGGGEKTKPQKTTPQPSSPPPGHPQTSKLHYFCFFTKKIFYP